MENKEQEAPKKNNKFINKLLGIIDFSLAIYLVYNIIAMLAE